jgi:hypothetical protein
MRRFIYILGVLTLTIVVAAAIGLGVLFYRGHALDAESKAFVDSAVSAIATNWSEEQLLDRATPELRETIRPDELSALFAVLSRLGRLVRYEGATGGATMSYMASSGSTVSAFYVAKARFENGTAIFRILLVRRAGRWMINGFHVDSAPGGKPPQRI